MADLTHDAAVKLADALSRAAKDSPVRQYRYELAKRAREWKNAADQLAECQGEGVIEFAGALSPGMPVLWQNVSDGSDWSTVIRTMHNGGQFTVHVDDGTQRGAYLNRFGPASPVVVQL